MTTESVQIDSKKFGEF
jgi:hypothetical protein